MKKDLEMKIGEEYTFRCNACCTAEEDIPCILNSTGEFMPEFCPFEGKKCKWEMVMEDEE